MNMDKFEDAQAYLSILKHRLDGDEYAEFLRILGDLNLKTIDIVGVKSRVKQLFKHHPNLILGFNTFLPQESKIVLPQRPATKQPIEAINFANKIKSRFETGVLYQQFLEIMNLYWKEGKPITEVYQEVAVLFCHHPDLLDEFTEFLPIDDDLPPPEDRSSSDSPTSPPMHEAEKRRDRKRGREGERLEKNVAGKSHKCASVSMNTYNNTPKPITDDGENPSYEYREKKDRMRASKRTKLDTQVLNDCWVLAKLNIDGNCRKKNQYEEKLFSCEDDQFEMDMLLESVKGAAKHAEEFLDKINGGTIELESPIRIEEHFTTPNLRCIQRIYGESGEEVMDLLHENPSIVLPVVLTRLKQKEEEWSNCRSEFNKVWSEIYAKNHHKSLDHRSCKLLENKDLVAEVNENEQCNDDLSTSA